MNFKKVSHKFLLIAGGIGLAVNGYSQTYFYSGPVDGFTEVDLTPGGAYDGGFHTFFGTITETLYYTPGRNPTLEAVGSVTVSQSTGSFNMVDPIHNTTAGSANLTVGNNGSASFDTVFTFVSPADLEASLKIPVSGSGTYNGQAWSGNWNVLIPLDIQDLTATSASLSFSEYQTPNPGTGMGNQTGSIVVSVPGAGSLRDGSDDGTYYYSWNQNTIVAEAAPEPNSISLCALGLLALVLFRPRFQNKA